jgi:hypothetical protein
MGKQNKQRRAKRKRQREQQRRRRPPGSRQRSGGAPRAEAPRRPDPSERPAPTPDPDPLPDPDPRPDLASTEVLLGLAVWALGRTDAAIDARLLRLLAERADTSGLIDRRTDEGLAAAWTRGWGPTDLVHLARRFRGSALARLAIERVRADTASRQRRGEPLHPRWVAQVDALTVPRGTPPAGLTEQVLLLRLLAWVPEQPAAVPPPGSSADPAAGKGLDQRVLERVRALLAKAESTEFDEEAEALTAKAQELIARHAIDEALLERPEEVGEPSVRRVHLDDPYLEAKAVLLQEVAAANGCRGVLTAELGSVTLVGYDSALDAVELLHASLLAQATAAMVRAGARRDAAGRSRTRSFRRSFLLGFAERIGERLRAAGATQGAPDERRRALPVLASREERVEEAIAAAFPGMVRKSYGASHAGGYEAGRVAAQLAELDASSGELRQRAP